MARIVFRMLPQTGHHYGTFSLALELKNGGHEVIYASNIRFRKSIEDNGFLFYEIKENYDIILFDSHKNKSKMKAILRALKIHIFRRFINSQFNDKLARRNLFSRMISDVNPDLILLDSSLKFWGLQIVPSGVKFISVQTFVSTLNVKPPRDSSYIPRSSGLSNLIIWLTWRLYFFRRWSYSSPKSAVKILAKHVDFPLNAIDFKSQGAFGYKSVPEINTTPFEFDFPHKKYAFHYYFRAPGLFDRREIDYDYQFQQQYQELKDSMNKTIFCAFGSLSWRYDHQEKLITGIFKLFKEEFQQTNLILCIDNDLLRRNLRNNKSANIYIFKKVPQLIVLKEIADVMINHGGMNSIMECIFTETPMLVFPGSVLYDQFGNAARVVYHKIGLRGKFTDDGKKTKHKINMLLNDDNFRINIALLNEKIKNSDCYTDINLLIENYLKD